MQLIWCLLSIFYLNMFRALLCPSSGEQDHVLLHMVFCTGCAGCGCVELDSNLCALSHSAHSLRPSSTQHLSDWDLDLVNYHCCPEQTELSTLVLLTLVSDDVFMKEVETCSMHYALQRRLLSSCNNRPIVVFVLSTNSFSLVFGGTE